MLAASQLSDAFSQLFRTRKLTEVLCEPLNIEDFSIQSQIEASPPKWHLAHTSWFFENFILVQFLKDYQVFDKSYNYLFNSYYQSVGPFLKRDKRGALSRPVLEEIFNYRRYVDQHLTALLSQNLDSTLCQEIAKRIEIGIHHEKQHQELLLMDILLNFYNNPLRPIYQKTKHELNVNRELPLRWTYFEESVEDIGSINDAFCFDNETPQHRVNITPHQLANRLITNAEYLEFMDEGGYTRSELWLSDGWDWLQKENVNAPLYWVHDSSSGVPAWYEMTLSGLKKLNLSTPVSHVSYYEADAFARWKNKRLPTEYELEQVAKHVSKEGNFIEQSLLQATPANTTELCQVYGDLWEWTQSAYSSYPGYRSLEGSLGEYNGKFMVNQLVLKGGSFATPQDHIRATYRNFYPPTARWQFSGIRLAEDV